MIDKRKIEELTLQFLLAIGEDPTREGLIDTPRRVAEMCVELFDFESIKKPRTSFRADNYDGIVMVHDIEFSSICEHHLMPFVGIVHIAYIPNEKVIGISKLARIIDEHAKRPQMQERLAKEIVADISSVIKAKGVAIYIEAKHLCMNIRGIKRWNASTCTTVFLDAFKESKMQEIFMQLLNKRTC